MKDSSVELRVQGVTLSDGSKVFDLSVVKDGRAMYFSLNTCSAAEAFETAKTFAAWLHAKTCELPIVKD